MSVPSRNGRIDAGEFNSPRPPEDGSAGIYTRTPGASVRAGGSTPPDNTRLTCRSRVLRGVAFLRNCRQLLRIKVFNPRRNCTHLYGAIGTKTTPSAVKVNKHTAFTLGVKPRGTRPAPPVDCMDLVGDERAQSIQIGAVLLFGVLIIAFQLPGLRRPRPEPRGGVQPQLGAPRRHAGPPQRQHLGSGKTLAGACRSS